MSGVRENRITEVMEGVESYGQIASNATALNPLMGMAMAQWIATLLQKLVDWGALTEEEHTALMGRMVMEIERRREEAKGEAANAHVDGDVQALLDRIGI